MWRRMFVVMLHSVPRAPSAGSLLTVGNLTREHRMVALALAIAFPSHFVHELLDVRTSHGRMEVEQSPADGDRVATVHSSHCFTKLEHPLVDTSGNAIVPGTGRALVLSDFYPSRWNRLAAAEESALFLSTQCVVALRFDVDRYSGTFGPSSHVFAEREGTVAEGVGVAHPSHIDPNTWHLGYVHWTPSAASWAELLEPLPADLARWSAAHRSQWSERVCGMVRWQARSPRAARSARGTFGGWTAERAAESVDQESVLHGEGRGERDGAVGTDALAWRPRAGLDGFLFRWLVQRRGQHQHGKVPVQHACEARDFDDSTDGASLALHHLFIRSELARHALSLFSYCSARPIKLVASRIALNGASPDLYSPLLSEGCKFERAFRHLLYRDFAADAARMQFVPQLAMPRDPSWQRAADDDSSASATHASSGRNSLRRTAAMPPSRVHTLFGRLEGAGVAVGDMLHVELGSSHSHAVSVGVLTLLAMCHVGVSREAMLAEPIFPWEDAAWWAAADATSVERGPSSDVAPQGATKSRLHGAHRFPAFVQFRELIDVLLRKVIYPLVRLSPSDRRRVFLRRLAAPDRSEGCPLAFKNGAARSLGIPRDGVAVDVAITEERLTLCSTTGQTKYDAAAHAAAAVPSRRCTGCMLCSPVCAVDELSHWSGWTHIAPAIDMFSLGEALFLRAHEADDVFVLDGPDHVSEGGDPSPAASAFGQRRGGGVGGRIDVDGGLDPIVRVGPGAVAIAPEALALRLLPVTRAEMGPSSLGSDCNHAGLDASRMRTDETNVEFGEGVRGVASVRAFYQSTVDGALYASRVAAEWQTKRSEARRSRSGGTFVQC